MQVLIICHDSILFHTQTLEDFYEQLLNKSCQLFPHDSGRETLAPYLPHSTAPTAYDAVWSLALAWNEAIPELLNKTSICEMDNSTQIQSLASEVLERSMMNVVLSGISVSIVVVLPHVSVLILS